MGRKSVLSLLLSTVFVVGFATVGSAAPDGKTLYEGKCVSCHGTDGKGREAIAKMFKIDISKLNLVDLKKSDAELAKIVADGIKDTKMKGYSDKMTGEEIAAVVKHIRSLKK